MNTTTLAESTPLPASPFVLISIVGTMALVYGPIVACLVLGQRKQRLIHEAHWNPAKNREPSKRMVAVDEWRGPGESFEDFVREHLTDKARTGNLVKALTREIDKALSVTFHGHVGFDGQRITYSLTGASYWEAASDHVAAILWNSLEPSGLIHDANQNQQ